MTARQWAAVERLLDHAVPLPPTERAAFAADIADPAVRHEVESLLQADDDSAIDPSG